MLCLVPLEPNRTIEFFYVASMFLKPSLFFFKVEELEMTLFRDEDDKLITYMTKIASNRCILVSI
jgi:hypothetical protein